VSIAKPSPNSRITHHASRITPYLPRFLLTLLILIYIIYFSWYSINRHNTLHSYAADLSLIDQPIWNTVLGPGDFMELTWGERQQPRLAEHFEPILIPLALLFYLWDDVRILLIAQSVALALGALPVYWIAKKQLAVISDQGSVPQGSSAPVKGRGSTVIQDQSPPSITNLHLPIPQGYNVSNLPAWAALVFSAVYLLLPHLQAANIADFHADPFVVAPLLLAFWYATERRWGWMWLWAIVAMSTKETLPPLTAMLGLWLWATAVRRPPTAKSDSSIWAVCRPPSAVVHALTLILVSTAWFLGATFLIVAPLAQQHFGATGPIYFTNRYVFQGGLADLLPLLQDPLRWRYVLGLLAAVGFLPLLAPELLILGLPVLVANLLSNFPGQHSGEQHYSAPLAVALIVSAIYAAGRLIQRISLREKNGQSYKMTTMINLCLWLLSWSLGYHALHGWTPLSSRVENYVMTPTAARLPHFLAAIPPEAVVSASAAIHPHLAHRRVIYLFPTVQDADYVLVAVADIPGVHPNDAHTKLLELFANDWRILQADQGLILAQRHAQLAATSPPPCADAAPLPCPFYDFARSTIPPAYPTPLTFGDGRLQLLGYDFQDDPDNGLSFRFYWQTTTQLPDNLRLWPLIYDDWGQLLSNSEQMPMVAALWYPPAAWQPGETVVTQTLPQLLPERFHVGLAVGPPGGLTDPSQRFPVQSSTKTSRSQVGRWMQLASFQRRGSFLNPLPATPTLQTLTPLDLAFGSAIRLTGFSLNQSTFHPGDTLSLLLHWTAGQPVPSDYTVFVHLLAPDGQRVAQHDAFPTWLTPQPTSQWPLQQPILDNHRLTIPANLPPGFYTLQLGLYHAQTLARLPLSSGGDSYTIGPIYLQ
jgi:uncharacterized membrane protein